MLQPNSFRNPNSDRILILCYPPEAGGKFVGNCLALSQHCYLQDQDLVIKQQQGLLSPKQKLELLLKKLSEVNNTWTDLDMGDGGLHTRLGPRMSPITAELSRGSTYWFQCTHGDTDYELLTKTWPNHKKIVLVNSNAFVNYRYGLHPDTDRTLYAHLHQYSVVGSCRPGTDDMEFDVYSFFDKDSFLREIKKLYNRLAIPDYNSEYLTQFYLAWMSVLRRLRQTPEKIIHVHGPAQYLRTQQLQNSQESYNV